MFQNIYVEEKASVCWLNLNRPQVKNAMDAQTIRELKEFFSRSFEGVRAVVLRGTGDFFCAGGDLNWMKSSLKKCKSENEADALELAKMLRALDECPVPVICQVKGGAFGGGVGLVAVSDIVIADEKAQFSLSEVRLGLIPATIGPLVMRKIGYSQARRLYLTGKRFPANEAKEIRLVHEVVPADSIHVVTLDYLRLLGSCGPAAVRTAKKLARQLTGERLWKEDVSEETSKLLSEVRVGAEAQEGMAAFFEKRKASWCENLVES